MREEDGKLLKNAHILGTIRRILKLLYHRIRPIFVFDGATPDLKLNTVKLRRKQREKSERDTKITAQKILLMQLKQQTLTNKLKTNNVDAIKNSSEGKFVSGFNLPANVQNSSTTSSNGKLISNFLCTLPFSNDLILDIIPKDEDGCNKSQTEYSKEERNYDEDFMDVSSVAIINNIAKQQSSQAHMDNEDVHWVDGYENLRIKSLHQDSDSSSEDDDTPHWDLPTDSDDFDVTGTL
jgi:hypothetical protein